MDGAWIGAISALSGVAVSGITSSFRSRSEFRRDKSWALHLERRAQIEELYEIVEQISETYGRMFVEGGLAGAIAVFGRAGQRAPQGERL